MTQPNAEFVLEREREREACLSAQAFLSSPIGGASTSYFKNFCPRPLTCPRSCPRVILFFRTITLESLNQCEPNFHR